MVLSEHCITIELKTRGVTELVTEEKDSPAVVIACMHQFCGCGAPPFSLSSSAAAICWGGAAGASGAAAADDDSDGDVARRRKTKDLLLALAIRVLILTFF